MTKRRKLLLDISIIFSIGWIHKYTTYNLSQSFSIKKMFSYFKYLKQILDKPIGEYL
jgi:hypothetical protein